MKLKVLAVLLASASPFFAQYAGPALLSRGEAPAAMVMPDIKFRPKITIGARYSTALAGLAVDDNGQLADDSAYGGSLTWGVSGSHAWRRTKLGLSYYGSFYKYAKTHYDTMSNSMLLGIGQQLSRHVMLSVNSQAGIISRDFGLLGLQQTVPFDPTTTTIPATDYFDNRTYHAGLQTQLSIQKSARLSFAFGGGVSYTKRLSKALVGNAHLSGMADVQYRVSRRSTIGMSYGYAHQAFSQGFGSANIQTLAGTFGRGLTRFVEFSGYAGVMRPETEFLQSVRIDPVIVALLGITSGSRIVHNVFYSPHFGARLSKSFQNGVVYVSGGRGITPGNGLFLTSISTHANVGYAYTGLRKWSLNASAGHNWSESIAHIAGKYQTTNASVGMARTLGHGFALTAAYQLRRYHSPDYQRYNRTSQSATVGLGWSPGEVPLRLW